MSSDELQQAEAKNEHNHDDGDSSCPSSSSMAAKNLRPEISGSFVEYYGAGLSYCGYCKRDDENSEGRRSFDMKAFRLTAEDYQLLLDRGWRRSGNYCYHPVNSHTCCPNYPISCKASKFNITRSQRRCIENLNNFLVHGDVRQRAAKELYCDSASLVYDDNKDFLIDPASCLQLDSTSNKTFEALKESSKAKDKRFVRSCKRKVSLNNITLNEAISQTESKWSLKHKRRHFKPSLEDMLYPIRRRSNQLNLATKHKLEIKMRHVESQENKNMRQEEHKLLKEYQKEIHKEDPSEWTMTRYCDFLVHSPLIVEPIRDRDYITKEDCFRDTLSKYVSINPNDEYLLVKPPELPTAFGTYHCNYILDGELIAVGVLDILPKCATTVYFFYDPKYGYLNLGIYSALVEISMVRQISKHYIKRADRDDKLLHYYLGFYVHECKKMHYKTRFLPSYLLCSETCEYVPTEVCLKKLEGKKYARFSMDPNNDFCIYDQESPSLDSILKIRALTPVSNGMKMIDYLKWIESNIGTEYVNLMVNNFLGQYMKLVGQQLIPKLCLQIQAVHRALVCRHQKYSNGTDRSSQNQSDHSSESSKSSTTKPTPTTAAAQQQNEDNDNDSN